MAGPALLCMISFGLHHHRPTLLMGPFGEPEDDLSQFGSFAWAVFIKNLMVEVLSEIVDYMRSGEPRKAKRVDKKRRQPTLLGCSTAFMEHWLLSCIEDRKKSTHSTDEATLEEPILVGCAMYAQLRIKIEELRNKILIYDKLLNFLIRKEIKEEERKNFVKRKEKEAEEKKKKNEKRKRRRKEDEEKRKENYKEEEKEEEEEEQKREEEERKRKEEKKREQEQRKRKEEEKKREQEERKREEEDEKKMEEEKNKKDEKKMEEEKKKRGGEKGARGEEEGGG
ncbi:hypothetical protein COCNU_07G009730 [Cocos nucifera]|uniref:Uncharacterized protein n=1 Tax=Cocos nucifera TaxID=13894 RepID=A0A8K0N560_COCNU|nr:hypothetical protein COCNU_07G009730 [Cocos nucifera]